MALLRTAIAARVPALEYCCRLGLAAVLCTRRSSPVEVFRAYARRTRELDRVILSALVLGLSTRKVGETLLSILGRPVSATTVSQVAGSPSRRVAKTLDTAVAAVHRRPPANRDKVLTLDGVVLARKTGAGALRRPVSRGVRAARRRQEGSHRLPPGGERERGRMEEVPRQSRIMPTGSCLNESAGLRERRITRRSPPPAGTAARPHQDRHHDRELIARMKRNGSMVTPA